MVCGTSVKPCSTRALRKDLVRHHKPHRVGLASSQTQSFRIGQALCQESVRAGRTPANKVMTICRERARAPQASAAAVATDIAKSAHAANTAMLRVLREILSSAQRSQ